MDKINVTKAFLPPFEEYQEYLRQIWDNVWLTNQGPLLQQLEARLKQYLEIEDFHFVANGTVGLQLALNALEITEGEVITTPFTYVATTSAIMWERCAPVFVDIDPDTLCIDAAKIEAAITPKTKAIMPTHVFGNPCDVQAIGRIAKKHGLKVIYDAAHAFGVQYKGKSLLSYGDISVCSFHSTKLFHTIEGGALIARDKAISDRIELSKRFGHHNDDHFMLGINAKASEFQAAMGLCVLKYIDEIIAKRKQITTHYDRRLGSEFVRPKWAKEATRNYAYYPVVVRSEKRLLAFLAALKDHDIFPRRYFYPALTELTYTPSHSCPIAEDIAKRVMCLPLSTHLEEEHVNKICEVLNA